MRGCNSAPHILSLNTRDASLDTNSEGKRKSEKEKMKMNLWPVGAYVLIHVYPFYKETKEANENIGHLPGIGLRLFFALVASFIFFLAVSAAHAQTWTHCSSDGYNTTCYDSNQHWEHCTSEGSNTSCYDSQY
jgi:hypothetical protein